MDENEAHYKDIEKNSLDGAMSYGEWAAGKSDLDDILILPGDVEELKEETLPEMNREPSLEDVFDAVGEVSRPRYQAMREKLEAL